MRKTGLVLIGVVGVAVCGGRVESQPAGGDGFEPLFDGRSLAGWTTFFNGRPAGASVDDLLRVVDGTIHVYPDGTDGDPKPFGYFATAKEYSNYHLKCEYKWGAKRFAPRAAAKRDAGVLYHVVGPDKVWPRCVECQVQEGDTGDIWTVGTRVTTTIDPKTRGEGKAAPPVRYLDPARGGVAHTQGTKNLSRVIKSETAEKDGWNVVEVIVRGGSAEHVVNGTVVNRCTDIRQPGDGDTWVPVTGGRIAFQVEGAELYYRNIVIKPLDGGK
jgi:hypothetical protein